MLIDFLSGDIDFVQIITLILAIIVIFPVHESAHGLAAHFLGDDTARLSGRITLNPLAHLDLYGTIMMLVLGVGYAKPVPINPNNFKNRKVGMAVSSLAGPVSNFLLALVFIILGKLLFWGSVAADSQVLFYLTNPEYEISALSHSLYLICTLFYNIALISIMLGLFNLIPIPPLDGSRIVTLFLPERWYFKIMQYENYIMLGFFAVLLIFPEVTSGWLGSVSYSIYDAFQSVFGFVDKIGFKMLENSGALLG